MANEDETGRVVSEYGHVGTDRIVLCYEHFSINPLCDNNVCCAAWIVALSQLIRGCGVLRQLQACVGMARGKFINHDFYSVLC